ncbi:N-acetylmuramoyl-L-alanine amidase [Goekera deserti]|uniref:N-acetylmuramoyl-L-alanine amidase n=1 Tax=Goekera deserti TaxID=2497753 RepID=UPI001F2A4296|nr:N-acetylmuramoyl-L-alanine amidase [Goekera deserti]
MRRIIGGLLAFLVLTGTLLVLPVYAAPAPSAEPVAPSIDAVDLGSVAEPEGAAVVTEDGTVVDAGPETDVVLGTTADPSATPTPSTSASPTTSSPPTTAPPTAPTAGTGTDPVAASGREIDGVEALTVSQPDTDRFESVGVTWAQDESVTGVTVQIRTKKSSGRWTPWTTVEQDDVDPSEGSDAGVRGGTSPYWTGAAKGIEVVVQAADGSTPEDVQVQLIDPGNSAADVTPGAPAITDTAHAATAMPAIYSRAQWGADEKLMTWEPEYAPTVKATTIHHTADSNNYSAADVPAIMRSIYAYHAVSRGWGDIGYNVIVDKYGRAWEGRSGGLASSVVGAHAGGFNTSTFGVSMLGNYDVVDTPPALLETVASVIAWKFALYAIPASGTVSLVSSGGGTSRYAAGTPVTLPTIFGHRDVGATTCPGRYGYSHLGEIRGMVAQKIAAGGPAVSATPSMADSSPQVLLRNARGGGMAEWTTRRGDPGDLPLTCDWDGNGTETIAVFRDGRFFLFDSNGSTAAATSDFRFGDRGDTPLCGDWDGDGKDTVGIWRNGWFFLRNSNTSGVADGYFPFGNTDAQPAIGDWNGDGYDTVAVYQDATFYFANSNLRPLADGRLAYGDRGDRVVVGDWTGARRDSMGVFRAGTFYLTTSLSRSVADLTVGFGAPSDRPLVGDWDGNRTVTMGVQRGY